MAFRHVVDSYVEKPKRDLFWCVPFCTLFIYVSGKIVKGACYGIQFNWLIAVVPKILQENIRIEFCRAVDWHP